MSTRDGLIASFRIEGKSKKLVLNQMILGSKLDQALFFLKPSIPREFPWPVFLLKSLMPDTIRVSSARCFSFSFLEKSRNVPSSAVGKTD